MSSERKGDLGRFQPRPRLLEGLTESIVQPLSSQDNTKELWIKVCSPCEIGTVQ